MARVDRPLRRPTRGEVGDLGNGAAHARAHDAAAHLVLEPLDQCLGRCLLAFESGHLSREALLARLAVAQARPARGTDAIDGDAHCFCGGALLGEIACDLVELGLRDETLGPHALRSRQLLLSQLDRRFRLVVLGSRLGDARVDALAAIDPGLGVGLELFLTSLELRIDRAETRARLCDSSRWVAVSNS